MKSFGFEFGIERPDEVEVIYRWKCGYCDAVAELKVMGECVQYPDWPGPGWKRLASGDRYGGGWVCPKHEIKQEIIPAKEVEPT